MKLDRIDNREPQQVRITLSASTYEKLIAYLEYSKSQGNGHAFVDLKQLCAEVLRAFADRGDKDFAQWLRARNQQASNEVTLSVPKKEKRSRGENGGPWAQQQDGLAKD